MQPDANSESSQPRGRRSSRVLVSIPLLISGKREDGTRFEGTAEAVIVNKHGGKIRTSEKLRCGMQIRIAIVAPYRFQTARVVREEAPGEFGIELQEAGNLWGVYFPPDDWVTDSSETVESLEDLPEAMIAPPEQKPSEQEHVQRGPEADSKAPAFTAHQRSRSPESSSTASPLTVPRDGSAALIRGLSAVQMPFQERCVLIPVNGLHANIAVQQLVMPSTRVRIILLPSERVERAVVVRISDRRHDGKWILGLKFETPFRVI